MMTRTDRFPDIGSFLNEKRRLTEERDRSAARIERHWQALKDHEVRSELASNAVKDALRLWKPTRIISSLIGNASVGHSMGMLWGSGKGGWAKRAGLFALGLIAPGLIKRVESLSLEDIVHEVGVSVEHVRDHLRSRKHKHAEAEDASTGEEA